ncbi:MAG TPA: amidohydrolase family protein [Chitinophagaceae bacterium]|nr:amidohydrolase family protein [Chitinophagaceae bacterium]
MSKQIPSIPIIDSHLHLWDVQRMQYPWLDAVPAIRKSFFIEDYQQAAGSFPIEKMVFVQAECEAGMYLEEVRFVEEQALKDQRIQGIIAYAPLENGTAVGPVLDALKQHPLVKGVRRMYDDAPERCVSPSFTEGLQLLPAYGYSFDISIQPAAMEETIRMIKGSPDTQFILDHLGKPDIRNQKWSEYQSHMERLAAFPNVVAKISGLITEADPDNWTLEELKPYVLHAVNCFTAERLMFGGDWPVLLLGGTYGRWITALQEILAGLPAADQEAIFYKNAGRIYRLDKSFE